MTIDFNWIQGSAGTPSYSAKEDREILSALWDEGVIRGMKILANGVDRVLTLSLGAGVVQGDDSSNQGNYLVTVTATETTTLTAAPGANSRIDLIGVRINDVVEGGPAGNNATLARVDGTAAASPVPPAVPDSFLVLAQVQITAGQTALTQSNVTDRRAFTEPKQAVGSVKLWIGASNRIPVGWALLQGQAVGVFSAYPDLADLLGVTSGSVTLPVDVQGRVLAGISATDSDFGPNVGKQAGAKTHVLTLDHVPVHFHTINHDHASFNSGPQSANHTHTLPGDIVTTATGPPVVYAGGIGGSPGPGSTGPASVGHTHAIDVPGFTGNSGNAGTGTQGLSALQPSVALYIIVRVL